MTIKSHNVICLLICLEQGREVKLSVIFFTASLHTFRSGKIARYLDAHFLRLLDDKVADFENIFVR